MIHMFPTMPNAWLGHRIESRGNSEMGKRFYLVTRDLHLYLGLFISPFVLVFAISVVSVPKFLVAVSALTYVSAPAS